MVILKPQNRVAYFPRLTQGMFCHNVQNAAQPPHFLCKYHWWVDHLLKSLILWIVAW